MMMTEAIFWQLIEDAKMQSAGDEQQQVQLLIAQLECLTEEAIIEFDSIFVTFINDANSTYIYAAYAIINCLESDDGFEYFRAWLVGQGHDTYYGAIANPDVLADLITIKESEYDYFILDQEELLYAAYTAYEHKTNQEMASLIPSGIRHGEEKHFSEWLKEYPNLTAKFWPRCKKIFNVKIRE